MYLLYLRDNDVSLNEALGLLTYAAAGPVYQINADKIVVGTAVNVITGHWLATYSPLIDCAL